MKTSLKTSLVVAALVMMSVPALFAADGREAELAQIAREYKQAINSYNIDLITPRLADNLDLRMPLGITITSPAEFKRYMNAMANLIGLAKGGKYSIELPESRIRYFVTGEDTAFSAGTINEQVHFAGAVQLRKYVSHWLLQLKKMDGKWKIVGGSLEVDSSVFPQGELDKYRQKVQLAMQQSPE